MKKIKEIYWDEKNGVPMFELEDGRFYTAIWTPSGQGFAISNWRELTSPELEEIKKEVVSPKPNH